MTHYYVLFCSILEAQNVRNFTLEAICSKLQRTFESSDYFKGECLICYDKTEE